jgi:ATP-dependent helicase/nuclease subunit B
MKLKGQIDRVDRHRETGAIRIIDYKTMDRAVPPSREHLRRAESGSPEYAEAKGGKKGSRWVDLQLPLYIWLYSRAEGAVADIEPAYFALPKAVTETGLIPWDNFNEELQKSAVLCAGEIVKLIRTGVFWPPSETTAGRDDFAELFHGPGSDCFIPVKPGGVETGGDPE